MTSGIKIPVDAELNTSSVDQAGNRIGQSLGQAARAADDLSKRLDRSMKMLERLSRLKIQPIDERGLAALDAILKRVEAAGTHTPNIPAPPTASPAAPVPAPAGPPPAPHSPYYRNHTWRNGLIGGVGYAALGGMGPLGATVAGAIGRGAMVGQQGGVGAGIGAGALGLVGGLLALGVGKAVGGVYNKIGDAQQESIGISNLRKSLGDAVADFEGLRGSVRNVGRGFEMTYEEALKLSSEYAKQTGDYSARSIGMGAGLARSYGMDPSLGVSFLGSAQHAGVKDDARLALLIAEAISKSKFGAMLPEVLQNLAGYMSSQARANLSAPNVEGYLNAYTGLMASGRPGLDPGGSAELLNRLNAAFANGGTGESSQNFLYSILGRDLNPVQSQILQAQGIFGSRNSAFGQGSMYATWAANNGVRTPALGGADSLDTLMGGMKRMYPNPELRLAAWQGGFGMDPARAMALETYFPTGKLGKLQGMLSADQVLRMSPESLGALGQAATGDRASLQRQASTLLGNPALTAGDRNMLTTAGSGSDDQLRKAVVDLLAKYGTPQDEGEKTRSSIAALDNTMQDMATKLVDPINTMKDALLVLASDRHARNSIDMARQARAFELDAAAAGDLGVTGARRRFESTLTRTARFMLPMVGDDNVASGIDQKRALREYNAAKSAFADRFDTKGELAKAIATASQESGIPEDDFWNKLILERSGNSDISPQGAAGVFQIMPGNLRPGEDPTNPLDAARAAGRVMRDAQGRYPGDTVAARRARIAYYNGGARQGDPVSRGEVPRALETRDYLRRYDDIDGTPVPGSRGGAVAGGTSTSEVVHRAEITVIDGKTGSVIGSTEMPVARLTAPMPSGGHTR